MGERGTLGVVGSRFCDIEWERELTVRKTSTFFPGDGFAVYEQRNAIYHHPHRREEEEEEEEEEESGGCGGVLVFRVERYGGAHHRMMKSSASSGDLVLMGPQGESILTVKRKVPSLHQRWEGFAGADDDDSFDNYDNKAMVPEQITSCNLPSILKNKMLKKRKNKTLPLFSVRRSSIVCSKSLLVVEVYSGNRTTDDEDDDVGQNRSEHPTFVEYHVEGSFSQRCCAIYSDDQRESNGDGDRRKLVEIGRKVDCSTNVTIGKDVFSLRLCPGFDAAFAMGVVLALDQISADDGDDEQDNTNLDRLHQ